jgi:hypothetical protein
MYCRKCGAQNDDNAFKCTQCGEILQHVHTGGPPPANIPNYLAQSILVTLFCCLPFGIVAIVFAAQVNGKIAAGDIPGAVRASSQAKMWSWISFGLGLAVGVIYVALMVIGAIASKQ